MNKKLLAGLKSMDEVDYATLWYHLQTAEMCRGIMKQYKISKEDMATRLGLSETEFKHYFFGAYEYSIKDWAVMQAMQMGLGIEALKEKVDAQIQFPKYKDSEPIV